MKRILFKNDFEKKQELSLSIISKPDKIENFLKIIELLKSQQKNMEANCFEKAIKEVFSEKNNID